MHADKAMEHAFEHKAMEHVLDDAAPAAWPGAAGVLASIFGPLAADASLDGLGTHSRTRNAVDDKKPRIQQRAAPLRETSVRARQTTRRGTAPTQSIRTYASKMPTELEVVSRRPWGDH